MTTQRSTRLPGQVVRFIDYFWRLLAWHPNVKRLNGDELVLSSAVSIGRLVVVNALKSLCSLIPALASRPSSPTPNNGQQGDDKHQHRPSDRTGDL